MNSESPPTHIEPFEWAVATQRAIREASRRFMIHTKGGQSGAMGESTSQLRLNIVARSRSPTAARIAPLQLSKAGM